MSFVRPIEILFKPYKLDTSQVNDFAAIARDLKIAKLAKGVLALNAIFFAIGMSLASASFYFSFPAVIAFGSILMISLLAAIRFESFYQGLISTHAFKTYLGPLLKKMEAAELDWGKGVPDITKSPIKRDPKADFQTYYNNLYQICNKMPSPFYDPRTIPALLGGLPHVEFVPSHGLYFFDKNIQEKCVTLLEKCWAFALQQENVFHYFEACYLCAWFERSSSSYNTGNNSQVTWRFDEGKIRMPKYLIKAIEKDPQLLALLTTKETQLKNLCLSIIQRFYPEGAQQEVIGNWFSFEKSVEGFQTAMAFSLGLGNSPAEDILKTNLTPHFIPEGVKLDLQLSLDIAALQIQSISLSVNMDKPVEVITFVTNTPKIRSVLIKKQDWVDVVACDRFISTLQQIRPNLVVTSL